MSHPQGPIMNIAELTEWVETMPDTRTLINEAIRTFSSYSAGVPSYIPDDLQEFANNADAVAVIGVGKLYKSGLMNDSPVILITK